MLVSDLRLASFWNWIASKR